jgi:Domain of Unknown Function (DUF1206)
MTNKSRAGDVAETGKATARRASCSSWVHLLARGGLSVRGIIYILVATLATQIALGRHGNSADQRGALQQVSDQPFGRVGLVALALGFAGYASWRLLTMVTGEPGTPDRTAARQGVQRVAAGAQGLIYAGLCVTTVGLLTGSGGDHATGQRPAGLTARLMSLPAGRPLVVAIGAGVVAGGLGLVWWALHDHFEEHLMMGRMRQAVRRWAMPLGVAGYVARGLVLALIGASLIEAAAEYDPSRARGLDDILRSAAAHPLGTLLLLLTALGLLAFGLYSFVEARYRRLAGG